MFLKQGEKGLLVGQNGSGKTENAIFQLKNASGWPRIILDTKIEDNFFKLPEGDEFLEVAESFDTVKRIAGQSRKHWPDYLLVRPPSSELGDPDELDKYLGFIYTNFGRCFTYVDESYSFHNAGRIGAGFLGLITRGRSKGKTLLMGSQRPSWISRFCITEPKRFYIHNLIDKKDRDRLGEVIPGFASKPRPPEFHFWYYETTMEGAKLSKPVPFTPLPKSAIQNKRWL